MFCNLTFEIYPSANFHPKQASTSSSNNNIRNAKMYVSKNIIATIFAVAATASFLPPRQAGSAECNQARIQVVTSLQSAGQSIASIQDATVKAAAQTGLDQANAGVKAVAQTIVNNQTASATGRNEVEAGLKAMAKALASGNA